MKEISEEYQWKIFELLEGNLSDTERDSLFTEIQEDASLKHFYDTLKLTYLEPQKIEFPNKRLLLKKSTFTVFKNQYFKYSAAAAVMIIAGGYLFISHNKQSNNQAFKHEVVSLAPNESVKKEFHETPKAIQLTPNIYHSVKLEANVAPVKIFKPFKTNNFKPSTKLIDENQFLNQLVANEYLNNSEKKQMMLKWLLINTNNQPTEINENLHSEIPTEIKLVEQPLLTAEELESAELNEIWVKEAKQMLKKGMLPKIKLVTTKNTKKWLPTVGIEIQTETASMVNNIFN